MTEKKYIIISGLNIKDNNRGTAALGYGSITFLRQKGLLETDCKLLNLHLYKNFLKPSNRMTSIKTIKIDGVEWQHITIGLFFLEWWLLNKLGIILPWSKTTKILKQVKYVAAINGGDGFSDIYGTQTFHSRLLETWIAIKMGIAVIQLPQTLGPFKIESNFEEARYILQHSKAIYVRDNKFVQELKKMGLNFEETKDLSAYMQPEPWNISIAPNSIGINVSGLAYSNRFRTLTGQFDNYPALIDRLICHFRDKGHTIYLIPHSYNYKNPEENNDDIIACREAFNKLKNKSNVILIDKDLSSPQIKYVISNMSFFIGTRMHANFAAIYTGVPLFGLAYSYKFEGAFNANGLDGKNQTAMINNITSEEIGIIINKIEKVYQKFIQS
ncbi:polysaccharide pyruvyl transferase family protein [Phocaeicola coprocola]|jgi:colanic acid/amylovoran biosynthesis protein|uniref:polysaccharide pyruvyl transferase family protein n=1 Tax=Phocaeicola coprocola TaxID=310298 RepID=UPI0015BA242F